MYEIMLGKQRIELHGWDAGARAWHGPDELKFSLAGCRHIVQKLQELPGSWYGKLQAKCPGEPSIRFSVSIHDLGDAGLGVVDLDGSPGGPSELILVAPFQRRARLRPELAFEFISYVRFLGGPETSGAELAMYEHVQKVLESATESITIVFSVETPHAVPELKLHRAEPAGKLVMSMIASMAEKDGLVKPARVTAPRRRGSLSKCSPGSLSATFARSDRSTSRVRWEYRA
jgi:hypothetical protein